MAAFVSVSPPRATDAVTPSSRLAAVSRSWKAFWSAISTQPWFCPSAGRGDDSAASRASITGATADELRRLATAAPAYEPQDDVDEAEEWAEPEELNEADEPQPFPLDALPTDVEAAVVEYQGYSGQPIEMVVGSAVSAISGCTQALVDVAKRNWSVRYR